MKLIDTCLKDVKLVVPRMFGDERGWFAETYNQHAFSDLGLPDTFVQDNQSFSSKGVLRGLHYQLCKPQGKLVRALSGHIWDVAVDLRPESPEFGKWAGFHLEGERLEYLWIPEGFAHGFLVLSESASVSYKTTDFYYPQGERCIRWDDRTLKIDWPLENLDEPSISAKDDRGRMFAEAEVYSSPISA